MPVLPVLSKFAQILDNSAQTCGFTSSVFRSSVEMLLPLAGSERDWLMAESINDHRPGADILVKSHHMRYSGQTGYLGVV